MWQARVGLFFNREETVQGHALLFHSAGHQGASGCMADLGLVRIPLVCPGFPGKRFYLGWAGDSIRQLDLFHFFAPRRSSWQHKL